jgi:hypothetical protein
MITWYEGEIVSYLPQVETGLGILRAVVRELTQGIEIQGVQMPVINGMQIYPAPANPATGTRGTRIAFYRDSAATAKFGFILSDPVPLHSPIVFDTATLALEQPNALPFDYGEVALAAAGIDNAAGTNEGGQLWLRNTGDAALLSGSFMQRIVASDSSSSIDIEGTNVDIYGHGNLIATHFYAIDDVLGVTSLSLGMRNPITGIGYTTLECHFDGSFTIGDSLGLSGIEYNLVPSLPFVTLVPQISLTSVPLVSELIVNPKGLTVFGPTIDLTGITSIDGATTITGATVITGATAITGVTTITPELNVTGSVAIAGSLAVFGSIVAAATGTSNALTIIDLEAAFEYIGPIVPTTSPQAVLAGIQYQIPVKTALGPMFLALSQTGWA